MAKPKRKPKFTKLDQRIYDAVSPHFYSTNKAAVKETVKRIIKKEPYWNPELETRQIQDPYFNEMFKYALGSGNVSDMEYFEESPHRPSVSKDDTAKYLRLKDLNKKKFLDQHQAFLEDTTVTHLPIMSSELVTTAPNQLNGQSINPGSTFGNLTAAKGEDEQGRYISIYDKWDLNNKQANRFLDRTPEMYDRIYLNEYSKVKRQEMNNKELEQYGLGGWIKENKEGIFGGLKGLAGGALMGLTGGMFGGGMLAGGIGDIIGEIRDGNSADQQSMQQPFLSQQTPSKASPMGTAQVTTSQYQPTFPMGGLTPFGEVPVELENDEVFRKPGEDKIYEVDGKYHSQGGESYKLPAGTEVLGKSINPATGNTFKQDGMKLKKEQDRIQSKGDKPGTIGDTTNKRKLEQVYSNYNNLFTTQEQLKTGSPVDGEMKFGGVVKQMPWGGLAGMGVNLFNMFKNRPAQGFANVGQSLLGGGDPTQISAIGAGVGGINPASGNQGFGSQLWQGAKNFVGNQGGFSGLLNKGAQLGGVGYNMIQGMQPAEHLDSQDYYNPFGNQAMDLMANRRFDIDPMLEANRNAAAIGQYNLKNMGASAGQQYAGQQGLAANRMRSDAEAWSQKSNIENQYQAEQAQTMLGVGQQRAGMDFNVANINQQADAARQAMLGQGFSDLSKYAQMQQLMKGQQQRDQNLAGIYPDMFSQVYPYMQGTQNIINKYK